jgi:hypothetical protein
MQATGRGMLRSRDVSSQWAMLLTFPDRKQLSPVRRKPPPPESVFKNLALQITEHSIDFLRGRTSGT